MPAPTAEQLFADVARIRLELLPEISKSLGVEDDATFFGSGRLIGRNLVLTVRHVLETEDERALPADGWEVRLVSDQCGPGLWDGDPLAARVVWRGPRELDLALLELLDCERCPEVTTLRFGRYDSAGNLRDCWVAGFPYAARENSTLARAYSFFGALRSAAPGSSYRLTIKPGDAPAASLDWHGVSGGSVLTWRDDEVWLLGAVQHVPRAFGPWALDVMRHDAAWEDELFVSLIAGARSPEEPRLEVLKDGLLEPQPELHSKIVKPTHANRLIPWARHIPRYGRQEELERLHGFLEARCEKGEINHHEQPGLAPFLWWLVTGSGGQGKSRLALEFTIQAREKDWNAGFLPNPSSFSRWSDWQPTKPTLIVVNYVAKRAKEIGKITATLARRGQSGALKMPVRLLLIERRLDLER